MSENPFIKLKRRFRKLKQNELEDDIQNIEDMGHWFSRSNVPTWFDLEQRFRTIILAEGGSGKTREMQERQKALTKEDKYAFFIPLEALAEDSVEDLLGLEGLAEHFQNWQNDTEEHAWLFLDAVDELKLKDGRFKKALQQLRLAISNSKARAHIIISCRPSDWKEIDIKNFQETLPPPLLSQLPTEGDKVASECSTPQSPEDCFLAPLMNGSPHDYQSDEDSLTSNMETAKAEKLEIYQLTDLDDDQIKTFVWESAKNEAASLLDEIKRKDRWNFARRPQDLIELISLWRDQQNLGSYTQQIEAFLCASLRERAERPREESELSPDKAKDAAEHLAFALAVAKKRTIHEPEAAGNLNASIDSKKLLRNFNRAEIEALMRLRLFDPATYSRIKFHRRDIEEYLAARHIQKLYDRGVGSKTSLLQLLFTTTTTGEQIIIPSRKTLAVWLAQWRPEVREKLLEINPVLLITDADAEYLTISDRCKILRTIANHPEPSRLTPLPFAPAMLRRFSSPELADTINEIWNTTRNSDNFPDFILSLVKEGRIAGCKGLLNEAVRSDKIRTVNRIISFKAIVEIGEDESLCRLTKEIVSSPSSWPAKLIRTAVADLFPNYLTVEQLINLITELGESQGDYSFNFDHSLRTILKNLDPVSDLYSTLRDKLAQLILKHQSADSAYYYPQSRFGWLSGILSEFCHIQSSYISIEGKKSFLQSCIVSNHFRDHGYQVDTIDKALKESIDQLGYSNEEIFLSEYEFVTTNFPEKNGVINLRSSYSFISQLTDKDQKWLRQIIQDSSEQSLSSMSFRELLCLWSQRGMLKEEIDQLRATARGKDYLESMLESWLEPRAPNPNEKKRKKLIQEREQKEARHIESWKNWRTAIINNPKEEFKKEYRNQNIGRFFDWLWAGERSGGSYQAWNSKALKVAFNEEVYEYALKLFSSYWRSVDITPYSACADDQNRTPYTWIFALNGVIAEAENSNWTDGLSVEDVRQATRLAQIEINGLASILDDLAAHHSETVAETLSIELKAQLKFASSRQHLPLLQDLTYSSLRIKKLVTPTLSEYVINWEEPSEDSNSDATFIKHNLSQIISLLLDKGIEINTHNLESVFSANFANRPTSATAIEWLVGLMKLNAQKATSIIESSLHGLELESSKENVTQWFAILFNPFKGSSSIPSDPELLSRLVKIAYSNILTTEDQKYESGVVYSPDARDDAQGARSALLNKLIDLDHPEVPKILEELAENSVFAPVKQFIQKRAHVITINDLEPCSWKISEIHGFEEKLEQMPIDRASLDRLIHNRLDDLQHDIRHHDFFPRKTVREIVREDEMQRFLAYFIDQASNGLYQIAREDEAADGKKTDIRVISKHSKNNAVIEIKLTDKRWTVAQLEKALENQLQQQYLRHDNCRVGFLLITNHTGHKNRIRDDSKRQLERKHWLHPLTKQKMSWEDLISHLQRKADALAESTPEDITLSIVGLDLRDPILQPAH